MISPCFSVDRISDIDSQNINNYSKNVKEYRKRKIDHMDEMLKINAKRMGVDDSQTDEEGSDITDPSPATIALSPAELSDHSQLPNVVTELDEKDATVVIPAADGEDELELTGLFEKVSLSSPGFESLASAVSEQSGRNFSLPFALGDED
jgi:hypothetical protein